MNEDSQTLDQWAAQYRHFAEVECPQDPLYVAICRSVADSAELLALMAEAPATQRRPNLLLAALHERILSGADHGLAAYYPSVGGTRLPDAELPDLLLDFVRRQRSALIAQLRSRSTQTNEIGRCAVLWPALQHISALSGRQDLALLDFGCSAGLNLGVDAYRYDYGGFALGAPAAAERPTINCEWRGDAAPPPPKPWRLQSRLGLDPAPIDVRDEAAVRWLRACLWPHDRERARRLDQALVLARTAAHPLRRAEDCLAEIEPWLDGLPAGVQPVLFNSWVLSYFEAGALARHRVAIERLLRERGLIWLSAEAAALRPPALALPAACGAGDTLWTLQWAAGVLRQAVLACSHPHGRWLRWLAPPIRG
ncbi:DUF2332 domain-containing protein [Paucibacter sp. XJ19-41]|uniref:DUF2332 domain-containing protein n=1 Tax=Paucibacter sp. XJ19-41 TaxID=2927824 RepID=UPI00234B781B|nr:DUF2332 domain-containing protein [Paucibacter sp. XJ19-41]MDC6168655.1 DUF2332 domain-containing protein [Paucibacter sp. XJ19-41]